MTPRDATGAGQPRGGSPSRPDYAYLRALAEKATPGPWEQLAGDYGRKIASQPIRVLFGRSPIIARTEQEAPKATVDAAYIASASPETIMALLDELEELRAAVDATVAAVSR